MSRIRVSLLLTLAGLVAAVLIGVGAASVSHPNQTTDTYASDFLLH